MKLKKALPTDRSFEQIKTHYLEEKILAQKLIKSSREERKQIYSTMYDELFSKVPDHPRLTRRSSNNLTESANKDKFAIINKFLHKSDIFAEYAPGDCKFTIEVAKQVKFAYGIDISDQRNPMDTFPDNFELIIYDGYNLDKIKSNSIDIIFSDQLIEHFHPDDTKLHFELVFRILKKGGKYIFRTPHAQTGPHDISQYFSDVAEGFHLKEWTYTEINKMLMEIGYSSFWTFWNAKGIDLRVPYAYFAICEKMLSLFPKKYTRIISKYLMPSLCGAAIK